MNQEKAGITILILDEIKLETKKNLPGGYYNLKHILTKHKNTQFPNRKTVS